MASDESDAALVARVRSGQTAAYALIVTRYHRDVWRVAVAMLRDERAAENIVQQCFVDAYECLHQYDSALPLGVWLKAVARNLVRMEMRKQVRQTKLLDRYHAQMLPLLSDDAAHEAASQARLEALKVCREQLAPAAAEALRLRYEEGRPLADVAWALQRSVVATRQLLLRTRMALRDCVAKAMVPHDSH